MPVSQSTVSPGTTKIGSFVTNVDEVRNHGVELA